MAVWLVPEKLSAAQVPGRGSGSLWYSIFSLLLFETLLFVCVCTQLKFQLAGMKTPVTLRWRLHKPVKSSRPGVSFKSMIRAVNKHNKASQIRASTPPSKKSTMNMFMCSETNCETWPVLTIIITVVCENCRGIPCLLTISKTYTDVSYSTDLWLIFQSPTAEREGFTNSSQTEADSRLTRTVPLLCALTMSYRWGHNGWTTWHPVAWGVCVWMCVCDCGCLFGWCVWRRKPTRANQPPGLRTAPKYCLYKWNESLAPSKMSGIKSRNQMSGS